MDGFFMKEYYIENYMCDKNCNLLPSYALKLVQSVSTEHCENMGVYEKISARGQVFLISKQLCTFERQIKAGETVVLHTAPISTTHGIFPRMTYFKSAQGEQIGCCDARWFLLDTTKKRPMRKLDDDIDFPTVQMDVEKIAFPTSETEFLRDEVVRYSQIDSNGHLNNTEYLNYLTDSVGDCEIRSFQVSYKKEILGGIVNLEMARIGNQVHLVGFSNGNKNFEILAELAEN
ncbi:MAG: thioesterase [Bacillota bacterium]